ncbi:MAG: L,D-transpeptidase [Pseudolabrys sp.]
MTPEFSGSPFPYFPPQRRVRRPRVPSDGRFEEMLKRQPYLPHFVAGGPHNPLGGRALYLGSSIYRILGSNEPWTIGKNVSSGCIRMRNADVIDLYERVKVGTKVVVM